MHYHVSVVFHAVVEGSDVARAQLNSKPDVRSGNINSEEANTFWGTYVLLSLVQCGVFWFVICIIVTFGGCLYTTEHPFVNDSRRVLSTVCIIAPTKWDAT